MSSLVSSPLVSHRLVDLACYSLLPNHYHFLIKQLTEDGISKFIHKLEMGYAKYFNYKYQRSGSLFAGTYQAIQVETDEYLIYLSGYINANPEIHGHAKSEKWPWSSYRDYLNLRPGIWSTKKIF